jgi:PAS domain S-box-containing protein
MSSEDERFKMMVENSQDVFWEFDENANFTYVSPRIRDLLGFEPEELIGINAFDLMSSDEAEKVHRHFDPFAKRYLPFKNLENVNIHKDGHEVVVESSGTPIFSEEGQFRGYRGIDRDITARKQIERGRREREESYKLLVENQNDLVVKVGADGRFLFVSPSYCKTFGKSEEELLGQSFMPLVHEEDRAPTAKAMESLLHPPHTAYMEQRAMTTEGWRWLAWSDRAIVDGKGRIEAVVGVGRDITDRKRSEMTLLAATQAAEAANRAKDMFLAKVSHEIRTPLTAIIGFGELLEDAELLPEHKRYLTAIRTSGSTLASLINDILDLSKIEAGKLDVKSAQFSLHKLITKLAATQKQHVEKKRLSISTSIDTNVPDAVIGDPLRIQQVLLNLLGNAIKFTEKGNIDITACVAEKSGLRVLMDIAVKDTGVGIPSDLQEKIFEPFAQILNSKTPKNGGSGLGLTISRGLATLMGGSIRVESREDVGSTFHLLIPLQGISGNPSEPPLPVSGSSLWRGPVLNILLAEDNPINTLFIETCLRNMKHAVTVAKDGKSALDALNANTFDLVLMDIQMPVMNGTEVLRVIRDMEQTSGKHLTVIALTAYALLGDKEKYLNLGFDGYLSKPFKTKELMDELMRVLPS